MTLYLLGLATVPAAYVLLCWAYAVFVLISDKPWKYRSAREKGRVWIIWNVVLSVLLAPFAVAIAAIKEVR